MGNVEQPELRGPRPVQPSLVLPFVNTMTYFMGRFGDVI